MPLIDFPFHQNQTIEDFKCYPNLAKLQMGENKHFSGIALFLITQHMHQLSALFKFLNQTCGTVEPFLRPYHFCTEKWSQRQVVSNNKFYF